MRGNVLTDGASMATASVAVLGALMLLVAACAGPAGTTTPSFVSPGGSALTSSPGGSAAPSSTPSQATSSTAPSEAPMPSPTPSASGAADLPSGEVAAGTYRGPRFEPPIAFTLDDGWFGTVNDGFFDVQQGRGTPEVIAVQFANVRGVVGLDGTVVEPADAADAARIVRSNPGLTVLGESDSRLGGLTGRVIEVHNASGDHAGILDVSPGRLGIDDGRALWIAFLDTPGDGVLAVMVGGSSDRWDEALAIAEPVLETIRIGE